MAFFLILHMLSSYLRGSYGANVVEDIILRYQLEVLFFTICDLTTREITLYIW